MSKVTTNPSNNPPAYLNCAKAKAELIAWPPSMRPAKPVHSRVASRAELRAFAAQYPKAAKLFGTIVVKWQASGARHRSENGCWAAYTHAEWCEWVGLRSASMLKEHLDRLNGAGLIERTLGKFGGGRVVSFIRPTPQGLALSKPRSEDWKHLGVDPPTVETLPIEDVFKAAYQAHKGTTLKVLSKVEKAALKGILKDLPLDGSALLDRCVRNWSGFTIHVAEAKGFDPTKAPVQPSADYVRKHLQAACDFVAKALVLKPSGSKFSGSSTPPVAIPASSTALKLQAEGEPATLEEIQAILGNDPE